mgnify:CR=1 FL=1
MYAIEKNGDHLLVRFKQNFNALLIQSIIHHLTRLNEYPHTNDIWLIGDFRSDIRLGELEAMVKEFNCHCPHDATRTKTAIVATQGLTQAILELWVKAIKKRVAFDICIFETLEDACEWMDIEYTMVA